MSARTKSAKRKKKQLSPKQQEQRLERNKAKRLSNMTLDSALALLSDVLEFVKGDDDTSLSTYHTHAQMADVADDISDALNKRMMKSHDEEGE